MGTIMKATLDIAVLCMLVVSATCAEHGTGITNASMPRDFEAMLSDPVSVSGAGSVAIKALVEQRVVYVALSPGTIPGGRTLAIRHRGTGTILNFDLVEGGLDPVAITAGTGDTLDISATNANGVTIRTAQVVAPAQRPRIVRTSPPRAKKAVPLNARIVIIFSEPVDSSALANGSVQLLLGSAPLKGQSTFAGPEQLAVNLQPDADLLPEREYTIAVTTDVKDLTGDHLETPLTTNFVTQPQPIVPTGQVRITIQTGGTGPDPDGYHVFLDDLLDEVDPNGIAFFASVPEGQHVLRFEGVAPNCTVPENPRQVSVGGNLMTNLAVAVQCTASHGVSVSGATSGTDPDTNGFRVRVKRSGFDQTIRVPASGATALYGLVFGNFTLTLTELAGNCVVAGENPRTVAVPDGGVAETTFSVVCSSSGMIAYADIGIDGNIDIRIVRPSGEGNTRLTTHPGRDLEPTWSPDGSRIAFRSDRDGSDDVYVMGADGTGTARLTNHAGPDYQPAWSPDGTRIAFVSERDGNAEIYVMSAGGENVVRLTNNSARDEQPGWSPDNRKIVFRSERDGNGEIYAMNADGSAATRLTANGSDDNNPAWSPDGSNIVFSRLVVCNPAIEDRVPCQSHPFTIAADGSNERPLIVETPWLSDGGILGDADWKNATWSPDGRKIAFAVTYCWSDGDCHLSRAIWIVDVATGSATEFVNGLMLPGSPAWRP